MTVVTDTDVIASPAPGAGSESIITDPEFAGLFPRRDPEQIKHLESELIHDASLCPLVIWKETGILLDGYDLWPLLRDRGITPRVVHVSCPDRDAARLRVWEIRNSGITWRSRYEQVEHAIKGFKSYFENLAKAQKGKRNDLRRKSDAGSEGIRGPIRWDVEVGKMCMPPVGKDTVQEVHRCLLEAEKLRAHGPDSAAVADQAIEDLRGGADSISAGRWIFERELRKIRRTDELADTPPYINDLSKGFVNNILKVEESPLEILEQLPSDKVTAYISSYPYYCGQDYGRGTEADEMPYGDQLAFFSEVAKQQFRTLRPGGRAIINIDSVTARSDEEKQQHYKRPIYADIVNLMRAAGFLFYDEICWRKTNLGTKKTAWGSYLSPSSPAIRREHEYVLVFTKPGLDPKNPFRLDPDEFSKDSDVSPDEWLSLTNSVWDIPADTRGFAGHPCPYPEELVARLVKLYTYPGDWVIDTFVGSGTTTAVLARMKRRWTGIDRENKWCHEAKDRTENESTPTITATAE